MKVSAVAQNVLVVGEKKDFQKTKAFKIASSMNNNPRRRNARAKAYNCPWCDDWHVGHDNKLVPLWKQKNMRSTR